MPKDAKVGRKPIRISLGKLAQLTGGRLEAADSEAIVSGVAPIGEALADQITFLSDQKNVRKHADDLKSTKAAAVIAGEKAGNLPLPSLRFANPYEGFVKALNFFHPDSPVRPGIHPTAFVHEDAEVDPSASIGPLVVVEKGAKIGRLARIDAQVFIGRSALIEEDTHLFPQVVVREECLIGKRSIINSGAIIGSDGFGFYKTAQSHVKVPQVGIVSIGDDVEIGANVTIDRATMGSTEVGDGTKIDNLVHIAHNVKIGKNCIIVGQVGISGSTILEDNVTLAGQVGTVGHVRVGHGSTVAARGVVTQDVEPDSFVSGFPLKPHHEEKRIMAAMRKLPELLKTVRELKEALHLKENS